VWIRAHEKVINVTIGIAYVANQNYESFPYVFLSRLSCPFHGATPKLGA
jgi:hypothetical protein